MIAGKKTREKNGSIVNAIAEAEKGTTSEIHVHLSRKWREPNPYEAAVKLFHQFGLHQTRKRNAVLFYLNLKQRKFAIIGDVEANRVLGQDYWNQLAQDLKEHLKVEAYELAVAACIRSLSVKLRHHFPLEKGERNLNELPNTVTESDQL